MKYLAYYLTALIVCVAVDYIWLNVTTARLYQPIMGDMLAAQPNLSAAAAFYLLYAAGVTVFVGAPALAAAGRLAVPLRGALFGLFCYMTYDVTNQATLRSWALELTLADIGWGMVLTAISASVAYFVARRFA